MVMVHNVRKNTAKEVIDYLRKSDGKWYDGMDASHWVFRGQADAKWDLIPSAMRAKSIDVIKKLGYERWLINVNSQDDAPEDVDLEIYAELFAHIEAEEMLVKRFVDLCDECGLVIPEDKVPFMTNWQKIDWLKQQNLVDDNGKFLSRLGKKLGVIAETWFFNESMDGLGREDAERRFHLRIEYMLAQHHGVSTRLLDWTTNPLVAAHFAVADAIHRDEDEEKRPKRIAIWGIYRPAYYHSDLIFDKPYTTKIDYLKVQHGLFSFDLGMSFNFIETKKWRSIKDVEIDNIDRGLRTENNEGALSRPLIKITMPFEEIDNLRDMLILEGVDEHMLKPSFDTVGSIVQSIERTNPEDFKQ